jgi:hypothetical protein
MSLSSITKSVVAVSALAPFAVSAVQAGVHNFMAVRKIFGDIWYHMSI